MKNPQHGVLSKAYEEFPDPLAKDRRGGFDVHIYHFQVRLPCSHLIRAVQLTTEQNNPDQVTYARALYERIRRECKHQLP